LSPKIVKISLKINDILTVHCWCWIADDD